MVLEEWGLFRPDVRRGSVGCSEKTGRRGDSSLSGRFEFYPKSFCHKFIDSDQSHLTEDDRNEMRVLGTVGSAHNLHIYYVSEGGKPIESGKPEWRSASTSSRSPAESVDEQSCDKGASYRSRYCTLRKTDNFSDVSSYCAPTSVWFLYLHAFVQKTSFCTLLVRHGGDLLFVDVVQLREQESIRKFTPLISTMNQSRQWPELR
ncbi:hypothetical protein GYMLUDRAFT_982416 [Collybiopsis luxurians FD-317 M1]|uniref:Uncharacterized protein n=1 Tax=Collybiopsis luxurians FD-317 M1 TaxID=944289 RepID=A0A0D0C901_9AGAR|nr:hypothetical protein GYMLUDRAFT_982416 [Collybiopsis luxurians FD-317 M1]